MEGVLAFLCHEGFQRELNLQIPPNSYKEFPYYPKSAGLRKTDSNNPGYFCPWRIIKPIAGCNPKEKTKQEIIAAAMQLFKEHGFDATTMEQIAREADIAKGTLYNYFPVKEAIIDEHIKRSFGGKNSDRILRLRKIPDTRSRVMLIFGELIEGVRAQKEIFEKYIIYRMRNMVSFHLDESVKSGFHLLVAEIISLGQKNAEIRNDLPSYILEDLLEFAFVEMVKQFYIESENSRAGEVMKRCVDLFINGARLETKEKF
jgi:AcrR family transcriptional regulator